MIRPLTSAHPTPLLILALALIALTGCASQGRMAAVTATHVSLGGDNFRVVDPGVVGESLGYSLLGFLPISTPSYAEAKANLYRAASFPVEGRSIALANFTEDESSSFLFLVSIRRLRLSADIVEFGD